MLDLNLLPVFEALLLEKNVTAAAAHMGLTQSALSNALGRLRQYFGDALFVKTREGMMPTPRALELAQPLKAALTLIRASTQKNDGFDCMSSNRVFRLYMSDVGEMVFLPELVKRLRELRASIQIETAQMDSNDIELRLASGEIDFALGYLPALNKPIRKTMLFREHYVCMTRKEEGANGKAKLTLKKFLDVSHVQIASLGSGHQIIERTLDRRGLKRNIALRVPHFLVIPYIIAGTDLIATMPSRVANAFANQARLQVQPLPVSIPSFDVSLFWHPRFSSDPPIQWFRTLLIDLFQETRIPPKAAP